MSTTQPIKDRKDVEALKNFYLTTEPNLRNYALICTGINTALRIGDILSLTWDQIYNFQTQEFRHHIILQEAKTGKENCIAINKSALKGFKLYLQSLETPSPKHYIFFGRNPESPISRIQAFRIIRHACIELNLPEHISCHSLRKTFGYHAWKAGVSPAVLMHIFNHSSFSVTKRYLGIDQDDKDMVFMTIEL